MFSGARNAYDWRLGKGELIHKARGVSEAQPGLLSGSRIQTASGSDAATRDETLLAGQHSEGGLDSLCGIFRCKAEQPVFLCTPDNLAGAKVGFPDGKGAGIRNNLETLVE